jgi:hypothetical protein
MRTLTVHHSDAMSKQCQYKTDTIACRHHLEPIGGVAHVLHNLTAWGLKASLQCTSMQCQIGDSVPRRQLRRWATTNHGKQVTLRPLRTPPTSCTNDRRQIGTQTRSLTRLNLKTITRSRLRIQPSSRIVLNLFLCPSTKRRPLRTHALTGYTSSITPARLYLFSSLIRAINHDPSTTTCHDYRMPTCPHHDNITLGKSPQ